MSQLSKCPKCGNEDKDHLFIRSEILLRMTIDTNKIHSFGDLGDEIAISANEGNYVGAMVSRKGTCADCDHVWQIR